MSLTFDYVYFGDGRTFEATSDEEVINITRQAIKDGKSEEIFAEYVTLYGDNCDTVEHECVTFKKMAEFISNNPKHRNFQSEFRCYTKFQFKNIVLSEAKITGTFLAQKAFSNISSLRLDIQGTGDFLNKPSS